MQDSSQREIECLRISLTDNCNLRCHYCMPAKSFPTLNPSKLLSFDQIIAVVKATAAMGIFKYRLTGGESLMRPHVPDLVACMKAIEGVKIIAMTTNGVFLAPLAQKLKDAGMQSVNISLDTLDPEFYTLIIRGAILRKFLRRLMQRLRPG